MDELREWLHTQEDIHELKALTKRQISPSTVESHHDADYSDGYCDACCRILRYAQNTKSELLQHIKVRQSPGRGQSYSDVYLEGWKQGYIDAFTKVKGTAL